MQVISDDCGSFSANVGELAYMLAVANNEELDNSLSCITNAQVSMLSNIH